MPDRLFGPGLFQHTHQDFRIALDTGCQGWWWTAAPDECRHTFRLPRLSCAFHAQAAIDLVVMGKGKPPFQAFGQGPIHGHTRSALPVRGG
jgi:hypothetical protein